MEEPRELIRGLRRLVGLSAHGNEQALSEILATIKSSQWEGMLLSFGKFAWQTPYEIGGESLARIAGYVEGYASTLNVLAERRQLGVSVDLFLPLFILYTSLSMMEEGVEKIDALSETYARNLPQNKH